LGTQAITRTTDDAGIATASYIAYSTPGVGLVRAALAVTPDISRSVMITLVTPTTGLAGRLSKQFGDVLIRSYLITVARE
jgi:hypothetical protein